MEKYQELMTDIAKKFNLAKGDSETEVNFKARILYSLLGQMGRASLWDQMEDASLPSITHFKSRIHDVFSDYLDLYAEVSSLYPLHPEECISEIYNTLTAAGEMYHTQNHLSPARLSAAVKEHILFLRGVPVGTPFFASGLGCYQKDDFSYKPTCEIMEMYHLPGRTLSSRWNDLTNNCQWRSIPMHRKLEFLRTKPPFQSGYWTEHIDRNVEISLARSCQADTYSYYLYKTGNEKLMYCQLPDFMTQGAFYREISNCCLFSLNTLPPISYHKDGRIIHFQLNYLLPLREMNFIKMYSWPEFFVKFPQDFHRVMDAEVFQSVREILEEEEYQFTEE